MRHIVRHVFAALLLALSAPALAAYTLPVTKADKAGHPCTDAVHQGCASDWNLTTTAVRDLDTRATAVETLKAPLTSPTFTGTPTGLDPSPVLATGSTTARSLKDRFSDVVNVKDYGAKGDGTTDDTVAIQAALTAGRRVLVGPGTYVLTETVTLSAPGTVLVCPEKGSGTLMFTGSAGTLRKAVEVSGVGAGIEGCAIHIASGPFNTGVALSADRTFARGNTVSIDSPQLAADTNVHAIANSPEGVTRIGLVVEANEITASVAYGTMISIGSAPSAIIRDNYVHDVTFLDQTPAAPLSTFNWRHFWGIYISQDSPGLLCEGNRIENFPGSGIHINDEYSTSDALKVGKRVLHNRLASVRYHGISADYGIGTLVADNWVSGASIAIATSYGSNVTVSSNHIDTMVFATGLGQPDFNLNKYMVSLDGPSTQFLDNTFGAAGDALVAISALGASSVIAGNTTPTDLPATSTAVELRGDSQVVRGNTIGGAAKGLFALGTDAIVDSNRFAGFATPGADMSGVRATVSRNVFDGAGVAVTMRADDGVVRDNRIVAGSTGVYIASAAANNVLVEANRIDVTGTAISDSGTHTIKRRNVISGKPTQASGRSTQSGDGSGTNFLIAHGLNTTPTSMNVTPSSAAARALFLVTADATNLNVQFAAAPASGTNNVILNWSASTD